MKLKANENPYAKVFWRDRDISRLCFAADSDEGWADVYVHDEKGKFILGLLKDGLPCGDRWNDDGHTYDTAVLSARVTGDIRIVLPGDNA